MMISLSSRGSASICGVIISQALWPLGIKETISRLLAIRSLIKNELEKLNSPVNQKLAETLKSSFFQDNQVYELISQGADPALSVFYTDPLAETTRQVTFVHRLAHNLRHNIGYIIQEGETSEQAGRRTVTNWANKIWEYVPDCMSFSCFCVNLQEFEACPPLAQKMIERGASIYLAPYSDYLDFTWMLISCLSISSSLSDLTHKSR